MTTARPPGGAVMSAIPRHPKFGDPHRTWDLPLADGTTFCSVARWDLPDGKEIRPVPCQRRGRRVEAARRQGAALYGCRTCCNGGARVLVVAGEKTADAAKKLFPGWSVTTSLGGEGAVAKTDWIQFAASE